MGKNKLIVKEEEIKEEEVKKPARKVSKTEETLRDIAGGKKLENLLVKKNLLYMFYIAFLAILYISNTYYTSGTLRQIEKVKVQIKELRYEYVTTKKQLIELSRRNKVIERLKYDNKQLKESKEPPYKMEVASKENIED